MDKPETEMGRSQLLGLLLVACVIGPVVGFCGPIFAMEVATDMEEYPGERATILAFGLPLALAAALVVRARTRPWGVALLIGVGIGMTALVIVIVGLMSQLS